LHKAVVATEIEFYLHNVSGTFIPAQVVEIIRDSCAKSGIKLASAEQERGVEQYEIALMPSPDKTLIAADTERFKFLITEKFAGYGVKADFSAKPLPNQPGSGLHVHVHVEDAGGRNLFFRDGDGWSADLLHAIGGLLELMNPCMTIFAPYEASYLRFTSKSNAPTTVSWGTNNRTVAIRLPDRSMNNKHIEHRVAGSDADVVKVIEAILFGIEYGISGKCNPGEPIYGDASLPQYACMPLAGNLMEAEAYKKDCQELKVY